MFLKHFAHIFYMLIVVLKNIAKCVIITYNFVNI